MNDSKKEIVFFNGSFFILSLLALYFVNQLPVQKNSVDIGAGYFPSIIIWFIIIVNVLLVIDKLITVKSSTNEEHEIPEKQSVIRFLSIVGLLIVYVWSWEVVNYKLTTFLFLMIGMLMLYIKDWRKLIIIPAGIVLLIYLFFEVLLHIPMP